MYARANARKDGRSQGGGNRLCPQCRGVWLDRGELDKIAERLSSAPWEKDDEEFRRAPKVRDHGDARKRKSFLSEMFEFGD